MYPIYRLKFEDRQLNPIDPWGVYDSWNDAEAAFDFVVADAYANLGSVYLTEDSGDDEIVALYHYFVDVDSSLMAKDKSGDCPSH